MKSKAQVVEAYRRETITDAAVHVIARKGFDELTMHDVAGEAGVSKATLYLYFRNRDEIRTAAERSVAEALVNEVERAVDADGTPEDTLMRVIRRAIEMVDSRDQQILAALALPREWQSQFEPQMFARLRTRLSGIDSPARMWFILDCLRGRLERRLHESADEPREQVAASTAAMLLHGLSSGAAPWTTSNGAGRE